MAASTALATKRLSAASKVRAMGPYSSQGKSWGWRRSLLTRPGFDMILSVFVEACRHEHFRVPPRKWGLLVERKWAMKGSSRSKKFGAE
jgi:hypothetical protein